MSGLVIVYSRALRKGDFVEVNDVQGVVVEVASLATKIVNVRNEEITIPNSVLIASPIRNYSKLAGSQGTLLTAQVTIGYDAPWRQVHAMLIEAARRTPAVRATPAPTSTSARCPTSTSSTSCSSASTGRWSASRSCRR